LVVLGVFAWDGWIDQVGFSLDILFLFVPLFSLFHLFLMKDDDGMEKRCWSLTLFSSSFGALCSAIRHIDRVDARETDSLDDTDLEKPKLFWTLYGPLPQRPASHSASRMGEVVLHLSAKTISRHGLSGTKQTPNNVLLYNLLFLFCLTNQVYD